MDKYDPYAWIIGLVLIFGGFWLLTRLRMRREAKMSAALVDRFGCKALPIHALSGIRLIFDQPAWGGCLVIRGACASEMGALGSIRVRRVSLELVALTRSACPPVLLRAPRQRGLERMVLAELPQAVRLGDGRFRAAFATHADSLAIAEAAIPPRVQALAASVADAAGLMPEQDLTHAVVNALVELLESEDDKRAKGSKSDDHVTLNRWGTGLSVAVRAPNRRFAIEDQQVLDHIPSLVEIATTVITASARLQRDLGPADCRACGGHEKAPPTRVCERCGANYHETCASLLSGSGLCPVWGCGSTRAQLALLGARYAPRSWLAIVRRWLGPDRRAYSSFLRR